MDHADHLAERDTGVLRAISALLVADAWAPQLTSLLELLGRHVDVGRVALRIAEPNGLEPQVFRLRGAWSRADVAPLDPSSHNARPSFWNPLAARWYDALARGEVVSIPPTPVDRDDRAQLADDQVRSLLVAPLVLDRRLRGVVELHDPADRAWSPRERELLRAAAVALCLAMQRDDARESLRERDAQLHHAQRLETVGLLASGIAHDFNNLLTVMGGYAELLLEALPATGMLSENAQEIRRAAVHASTLTRQLLFFSRKHVPQLSAVDVNRVVRDLEKMLRRVLGSDVTMATSLEDELPRVRADPGQIEQVVLNLAVNARDAMPEGGTLEIHTRSTQLEGGSAWVVLRVVDSGEGMSAAVRARLFEPFFTTKEPGRGTGLGLVTVQAIVRSLEGLIRVESEVAQGTVEVLLPAAPEGTADDPPDTSSSMHRGRETVLVCDDHAMVRSLTVRVLRSLGYRVLSAATPHEALERLDSLTTALHLVVTDLVMPGMNGAQLVEAVLAQHPGARAVFTSGYIDRVALVHSLLDRGHVFLPKPFTPAQLARTVRAALDA